MARVLFVCTGNICRSPIAQGVFESVLRREGLGDGVESAGTGGWHVGLPPDDWAIQSAGKRGLDISGQRARVISPSDCERFDYVLALDEPPVAASGSLVDFRLRPGAASARATDPVFQNEVPGASCELLTGARSPAAARE